MNVGTISHVDHGKTTLTAAITTMLSRKFGGARRRPTTRLTRRRKKRRGITINTAHVEYETPTSLRPRRLPGPRRLRQEHDHRCRPDGRRDPGRLAADGPMPQTREHILLSRQVGVPYIIVFLNKCDMVDDADLLDWSRWKFASCSVLYDFPGDDIPVVKGSAPKALEGDKSVGEPSIDRLAEALDTFIPTPERAVDSAFLMPVEDVFSISGRGTVVTGRVERGIIKVGEEIEIVGIKPTSRPPARAWKCSANCSTRVRPATTSASCCAAPSVKTSSVVRCWPSRARSPAHHFTDAKSTY